MTPARVIIDDENDLEAACFAVSGFIAARRRQGRSVPAEVLRLYRKLELAALTAMSAGGPEWDGRVSELRDVDDEAEKDDA